MNRIASLTCTSVLALCASLIATEVLYRDDFEASPVGTVPDKVDGADKAKGSHILVSGNEAAMDSRKSLELTDAKGLKAHWMPLWSLSLKRGEPTDGTVTIAFDIMNSAEKPATVYVLPRDYGNAHAAANFSIPIQLGVLPDGTVAAGRNRIPAKNGAWHHIEMSFQEGKASDRKVRVRVVTADGVERDVELPFAHSEFQVLSFLGFSLGGDAAGTAYLDNVSVTFTPLAGETTKYSLNEDFNRHKAGGDLKAELPVFSLSEGISCVADPGGREGMSLEMRDSLEFEQNTTPILTLKTGEIPHIGTSKWTFSADLMLDARKPIDFVIEFRSGDPHKRFTAIIANPEGVVHTRGKTTAELCKVELGKWWTFSVTYDLENPEAYHIKITDATGTVLGEKIMENMPGTGGISWGGFVGYKKAEGSFYIDNMKLLPSGPPAPSAARPPPKPTAVPPTVTDARYGVHEKELMNFWQVESEQPLGVLLDIHGGGWMGGKKAETMHKNHLNPGYHRASISYPLVNEGAVQPAMLNAALRAVQFLRYKASEWNIVPQRIVVSGGSAGGCSSLLVALHDDVADPQSADPVERFSSRVAGACVAGAQTTMDPFVIKERIGEKTFGNPMPYKPFGAETAEELMANWDKHKELVLRCSPITHVSPDDPPLHLFYNVNREFPTTKAPNGIHSPIFGEILLEACKEKGVECHLQYWEKDRPKPAVSRQEFLERLLLRK